MLKKITLMFVVITAIAGYAQAGMVVGGNPITTVEEYSHSPSRNVEAPIVLLKPAVQDQIKLIPLGAFLEIQGRNHVEIIEVEEAPVIEVVEEAVVEEVAKTEEVIVEDIVEVEPQVEINNIEVSEVYISYTSDKKTLLTEEAKLSLKELAAVAKETDSVVGIITYAAGEPSMARRVALLRANIIKNALKSYGLGDGSVDVRSFGNQVNINQSRAYLLD